MPEIFLEEKLITFLLKATLCFVTIVIITVKICFLLAFSSVSTVSYMDEPCQPEDASRLTVHMENTYQLGVLFYYSFQFKTSNFMSDIYSK